MSTIDFQFYLTYFSQFLTAAVYHFHVTVLPWIAANPQLAAGLLAVISIYAIYTILTNLVTIIKRLVNFVVVLAVALLCLAIYQRGYETVLNQDLPWLISDEATALYSYYGTLLLQVGRRFYVVGQQVVETLMAGEVVQQKA